MKHLPAFRAYAWPPRACPRCNEEMEPVLYLGLPGRICADESCSVLCGPALIAASIWFNGAFIAYHGGPLSYLRAMRSFLFGEIA